MNCLGWEEGCELEALDEGTREEGSEEEDDGEEEYVRHIFTRVGEDTHEPEKKKCEPNIKRTYKVQSQGLTVCSV